MLTLIAESKTMTPCSNAVGIQDWENHKPCFDNIADKLMEDYSHLSVDELSEEIGITLNLARSMQKMIYEFPNKRFGEAAIEAYTGVVFKALDPKTLLDHARMLANHKVRIISSLYGWLRPDDIIKAYRMDFTSKNAEKEGNMTKFWKKDVTLELGRYLRDTHCNEILDLLPADASKCIDWKLIKRFAKVWKVDFVESSGEKVKTPHAGKLKTLRGKLLRQILTENIKSADELRRIDSTDYFCTGSPIYPDHLQFITISSW